ncbi:zinc finger protein ZAT10-like [Primulina huaijiensis]|uniref:zinc finger protein ZAT10-like n=1 Tax=Primulina huaijiensis TaxID=1492673 RepID=UPI003CC795AA
MCYKASEDYDLKKSSSDKDSEEEDLANCLVMLSNKSLAFSSNGKEENKAKEMEINVTFQCKSCKKVFGSHQALGGHRASHKRVKGCFTSNSDLENVHQASCSIPEDHEFLTTQLETTTTPHSFSTSARKMPKMHECTICRRVFSSGQALGGHKRCHWLTSISSDNSIIPDLHDFKYDHDQHAYKTSSHLLIDLNINLPIPQLGRNNFAVETKHEEQRINSMDTENEEKSCTEMKLRKLSELGDVKWDNLVTGGDRSIYRSYMLAICMKSRCNFLYVGRY